MLSNRVVTVSRNSKALPARLLSSSAQLTQSEKRAPAHSELPGRNFAPLIHIEGYQGKTDFIPLYQAKSILSRAIQQSQYVTSIQGIQGAGINQSSSLSVRQFHTNTPHVLQARLNVDIEGDNSVQGIQGDDCINFKLWMESCRRYGLENCDQQLQGIQTGRKTLAEVLAEQDELIRNISERYREEASVHNQSNCSVQGLQGWAQFPDVTAPCPQGVQGEDCVRFKLWLENCHRFGFSECLDQLENMSAGRKSLGQVLAEQDQLIRSVVDQHKQKRGYSTSASDPKSGAQWN